MFKSVWLSLALFLTALSASAIGQDKVPPQELIQYIRDAKKAGLKNDQIQQNALKAGWPAAAVKDAMKSVDPGAAAELESNGSVKPAEEQPATAKQQEPQTNRSAERLETAPTPSFEHPLTGPVNQPSTSVAAATPSSA